MYNVARIIAAIAVLTAGSAAGAQPDDAGQPDPGTEDQPAEPGAGDEPADPWTEPGDAAAGEQAGADPGAEADDTPTATPVRPEEAVEDATRARPEPLVGGGFQRPAPRDDRPVDHPAIFRTPTGYLLPAGVILSSFGVDTGGGVTSDTRIGLGDVAEFGFETSDQIATVDCDGNQCGELEAVQPYPLAQFRMGVGENQLFGHQPAVTLGFRKSFTRSHDARKTRVAELYLSASKKLGGRARIHAGGVFWDAGIKKNGSDDEVLLHDRGVRKQLRAFGGIELEPRPRSILLIELGWAPEFRLRDGEGETDSIHLRPTFSWGVRFQFANWGVIESGVRIPDIKDINLLDAQIFGQLKVVSRRFERFLDGLR